MDKLRIAVVGYGNIGKYTVQALQAAPDILKIACALFFQVFRHKSRTELVI